ncbi:hypothetical protein SBV42_02855 [Chlamydia crocodili]|uniref:Inclusion membrane protein n=1 Tax=Chlamydia crocodili TaxID=2766982 RepID=A0ABX8CCI8_9CHLA|nr:hypothetical protein [Chlamydia crocodili]QVE48711.1 hypothetical protein H9Q19_03235 [Chlamydia crocodili]
MASSPTPNSLVSSLNPEITQSRLSLFSDLTPLERGEISSAWKARCQLASCIGLFCLSLLAICAGTLVLTLLPATPMFIGIAFIALGSVLLVTSLLLHFSTRPNKKTVAQRVNIQDLQTQLQGLLATTDARGLAINGFDSNGDPKLIIQGRENLLAKFDRDLRKKEVDLYRLISSETENRHRALSNLSEFREMQERISEELELLYRSYNQHITGTRDTGHDRRLMELYQERDLLIQDLAGVGIEKANQTEAIANLQTTLNTLIQRIRSLENQITADANSGQQHTGLVTGLQPLLQEQNILLSRLSQAYEALINLSIRDENLTNRRIDLEKEIQCLIESTTERITFNREYKDKYLRSAGTINQLTNNLREKEATLLGLTQEIEALTEEVERLRNRQLGGEYTQEDIDHYRNTISVKEAVIEQLQEQVVRYRQLIDEAAAVNSRISQGTQENERRALQIAALEQREGILNTKILALQGDIDRHEAEKQRLRLENKELRDLVLTAESNPGSSAQIEALQKEIRRLTVDLEAVIKERADLSEALSITRTQLTNLQLRYATLREEVLAKDEEIVGLKIEIDRLRTDIRAYDNDVDNLHRSLRGEVELRNSIDILRNEIDRLEQEKLNLNARLLDAVEQNRTNIALLQQSEEEKERLVQEIQGLRIRHDQEKTALREEIAQLQQTMQDRHLQHTEETSRLKLEKNQLEDLLRDANRIAEHSEEGAMQMLATQLIALSSNIKQRKKTETQRLEFSEMLAFTAPRFFGHIGTGISCRQLRPGVYLEAELPEDATDAQKRAVIEQRCLREWFLALLGFFTIDQIEAISQRANALVAESQGQPHLDELFNELAEAFPEIRTSSGTLTEWLSNCYSYVTDLQIFSDYPRWTGFLFSMLQKMHRGAGGMLENYSEEEDNFLRAMSNFSGKIPLVLGSIGHGEGTTPGAANPLGDLNYENLGNITWNRLIRVVEQLLSVRSGLNGPFILEVHDICESAVRTVTAGVYTDMLTRQFQPTRWNPPNDL